VRLRGSIHIEHSFARSWPGSCGTRCTKPFVNALGALTGNQAMQQVKAGLEAIYLSGWQVAADANLSGRCTPTRACIRPSVGAGGRPAHQQRAARADQIHHAEGDDSIDWLKPDRGRRRGRLRRAAQRFELMKQMIEAGAPACTSRTSCPRRRSAATWAARCWCRRRQPSQARRGAARRRRLRRAHARRGAHRRRSGRR
jgi:isocitrate lyase